MPKTKEIQSLIRSEVRRAWRFLDCDVTDPANDHDILTLVNLRRCRVGLAGIDAVAYSAAAWQIIREVR